MAGNQTMERTIAFTVYNESNDPLGLVTVDLPEIEAMSDTVSGAGIAGEVESPVLGHYGSMTTTFTWRTIEPAAMELSTPVSHYVELRSSQQTYDSANGIYGSTPVRMSMRIVPKTVTLGTFATGASTETEQEFEVLYLKVYIDNREVLEIDKYNTVARFNGVDVLESVRADLGM